MPLPDGISEEYFDVPIELVPFIPASELQGLKTSLLRLLQFSKSLSFSKDDITKQRNELFQRFVSAQDASSSAFTWTAEFASKDSTTRVHPWAQQFATYKTYIDSFENAYSDPKRWEKLESFVISMLDSRELHQLDLFLVANLVFTKVKEKAAYFIMHFLLNPVVDIYKAHNTRMLLLMDGTTRLTLAEQVYTYNGPIFPPHSTDLNSKLFARQQSPSLQGGGGTSVTQRSRYTTQQLEGGEYYPSLWNAEGQQVGYLDLSAMENWLQQSDSVTTEKLQNLYSQLNNLQTMVRGLLDRGRGCNNSRVKYGRTEYSRQYAIGNAHTGYSNNGNYANNGGHQFNNQKPPPSSPTNGNGRQLRGGDSKNV